MSEFIVNEDEDATLQDEELGIRARRCKVPDSLTEGQEDALAEWFQSQPLFFDQSERDFKDKDKRERLLEEKAQEFGLRGKDIMLWFKSQRTIYGRLKKKKSWQNTQTLTARQRWVLRTFNFLSPYLIARSSRNCNKHNHLTEMRMEEDSWDEEVSQLNMSAHAQFDPLPGMVPAAVPSEDERLDVSARTPRTDIRTTFIKQEIEESPNGHTAEPLTVPQHVLEQTTDVMPTRRSGNPRAAWAQWLGAELMELSEDLWRRFQRESFELVMRFKEQNQTQRQRQPNSSASVSSATFHSATVPQQQHYFL